MSLLNTKTFLITRRIGPGLYIQGEWVPGGGSAPFSITGSLHPTDGKKLETLLEGKRISSIYIIFTSTRLVATDPVTKTEGDLVNIGETELYEVIQVKPWQNGLINHYECVIIREKEGTP